MLPLTDLYLGGFPSGLYEDGSNDAPGDLESAIEAALPWIVPRGLDGMPDPGGKVVVVSLGMSTTTQAYWHKTWDSPEPEPWSFAGQVLADPEVDQSALVLFNGARAQMTSQTWIGATKPNYANVDAALVEAGLSPLQVQVVMSVPIVRKPDMGEPTLPDPGANAYRLRDELLLIQENGIRVRWPNARLWFLSSYQYGGYDTSGVVSEPYAYESGFGVKWAIAEQDGGFPLMAWGPYLWRPDEPIENYEPDGRHPSREGETAFAAAMLAFFKASPFSQCWFLEGQSCG